MSEDHMHAPTGAYALNALPDDERETFERHLRDCPACAQEVREFTATAARLGAAVTAAPSDALKARVMARVRTVRQLPPQVAADCDDTSVRPAGGRGRRLSRLVLAACAAVATAFGGVAAWQFQEARQAERQVEQARAEAAEMARVLAAPDARTVSGAVKGEARATVVVSRSENSAVFLASGLPPLPEDRTYQLWFDEGGTMRPAGLIDHDGGVLMEGDVDGASGMGVTVEPAGGSPRPTTAPVALMALPA
ncbi:anti-sigma factor [Streptomyces sp. SP18CS02]|uniref:anti-sigma factor n=1 Tax=Streptomyces sp. SP18CS02 TaxID=3002531 RepID=UPI002E794B3A|nr:anti-sigma factor [Streptomyces sp. SP18CS02]MEE1752454.1 anti-sigma factor [Streptomyces sp. SP18CS02]